MSRSGLGRAVFLQKYEWNESELLVMAVADVIICHCMVTAAGVKRRFPT